MTKTNRNGYETKGWGLNHSNLIHRQIAYKKIYLPKQYLFHLPFSEYEVHHIDTDKTNNNVSNLFICTHEEHQLIHKEQISNRKKFKNKTEITSFLDFCQSMKDKEMFEGVELLTKYLESPLTEKQKALKKYMDEVKLLQKQNELQEILEKKEALQRQNQPIPSYDLEKIFWWFVRILIIGYLAYVGYQVISIIRIFMAL